MRKLLCAGLVLGGLSTLWPQAARVVDDTALRNAGKSGEEWITHGATWSETRYSPLKQIDASNVQRLGVVWSYEAGRGGGYQEATPLVWNNTLYSITNWSIVFAVDARTGKEKWRWDPEVNQDKTRLEVCCGVVNRGIALYQGLIIAPTIDGRLIALDALTGKPVWESRVSYSQDGYTITMAPRVFKGKVFIGVSGAEIPVRGYFDAFDARTGKHAWRFYTVPGDPSKPFEQPALKKAAETWTGEWWKVGGGGTVWDGIAYDPDADILYVGTGNGGPWPQKFRSPGGGDNLFLSSILALRPDTGEYLWHFQTTPGDSWDYTAVQQMILADLRINGRTRKVIMQAPKNGFFYVLDRITGQFISGQPFAKVTWARGLDERTGRPVMNPEARYGPEAIPISPATQGGHNWAPMSFHPSTGLVYIPATLANSSNFAVEAEFVKKPGQSNIGLRRGPIPAGGGFAPLPPAALPEPPAIGPEPPPEGKRDVLLAWDPIAQKERWRTLGGGTLGGGVVTTAGNLVIQVIPDGRLVAYSADKGEKLLDFQTGLRGGMGPPITYQIDGKQYISLMGGTGIVVARNAEPGAPPPAPNGATVFPKVLTLALDGKR